MKSFAEFCDRSVGLGVAALILLTPLAFGSVDTWAVFDLEIVVFAIGCLWLTARSLRQAPRRWTGLEIPILIFTAIVLLQLVPLPRPVLAVLSPRITSLYAETVPGFQGPAVASFEEWLLEKDAARTAGGAPSAAAAAAAAAASTQGNGVRRPLTYSPSETIDRLVLFLTFALLYFIIADRYRDPNKARRLIVWIVFVGVGIAIEGIFQKLAWNGKILWFRRPHTSANPFGPFVNPNHFAGYMELIVPLTLGLLLTLLASHLRLGYQVGGRRDRTAEVIPGPSPAARGTRHEPHTPEIDLPWTDTHSTAKAVLLGFLLVLSVASIVLSLSRGGFLAMAVTFALFSGWILPSRPRRRVQWAALAGAVAILAATVALAGWLGGSAIGSRAASFAGASQEASFTSRADLWVSSARLIRDHPLLGAGLGGFEFAFYRYTTPYATRVWKQAHNDYIQLITEMGLIGAIPAFVALAIFLGGPVRRTLRDRDRRDRYLIIGLVMAIVSMLLHSLVDFSLQIPAVGLLFVVLSGLLTALSLPAHDFSPNRKRSFPGLALLRPLGAAALLAASVLTFLASQKQVGAVNLMNEATQLSDTARALDLFEKATLLAPNDPGVAEGFADEAVWVFDSEYRRDPHKVEQGGAVLARAQRAYRGLTVLSPLSSWGWWGLGEVYLRQSVLDRLSQESSLQSLSPATEADLGQRARLALAALRTAGVLEPATTGILDDLARLYLQEGLRDRGLERLRTAMTMWPELSPHDLGAVAALPPDVYEAVVEGMDAARKTVTGTQAAGILKDLGEMAYQRRDLEGAERRFREGLEVRPSRLIADSLRLDLAGIMRARKRYVEAEAEYVRVSTNPEFGWRGWIGLGETRAERGDHAGALQALRVAATLAPEDDRPALRIAREAALSGEREAAIGQLRYLIGSQPRAIEARALLVEVLRSDGKLREALAEAQALRELEPSRSDYRKLVDDLELSLQRGARLGAGG